MGTVDSVFLPVRFLVGCMRKQRRKVRQKGKWDGESRKKEREKGKKERGSKPMIFQVEMGNVNGEGSCLAIYDKTILAKTEWLWSLCSWIT